MVSRKLAEHHSFDAGTEHNHPPNSVSVGNTKYRLLLKRRSEAAREAPLATIRECGALVSTQVRTTISIGAQKKMCQRARSTGGLPADPANDDDFNNIGSIETINGEKFLQRSILNEHGRIMLFTTCENLRRLSDASVWIADGTFEKAPTCFYQLYTILANVGEGDTERYLPLAFFFLSGKSEGIYTSALEELHEVASDFNFDLGPALIITDFEKAAINAFAANFPNSRQQGCLFHLAQSFYRHVQQDSLGVLYGQKNSIFMTFKEVEALAFVPEEHVPEAFGILKKKAPSEMNKFIQYVEENYVAGTVRKTLRNGNKIHNKPSYEIAFWNVHQAVLNNEPRTSNRLEGFHNGLKSTFKGNRFFEVVESLKREQQNTETGILEVLKGVKVAKNAAQELKNKNLADICGKFDPSKLQDFLTGVALILANS